MSVVEVNGQEVFIDNYLKVNLDYVKKKMAKKNEMFVGIIDGRPGAGKSTLADQLAYIYSDGNFGLEDKKFTVKEYSALLDDAQKGHPHNHKLLDEAFEINKRKSQSMANMMILRQLQRIRSKGLWIWIALPCFYDLDKNVILYLADILIHCYRESEFGRRGRYTVFDRNKIKQLYLNGKDTLSYSPKMCKANFFGKFYGKFPSGDYDLYDKEKQKALDISYSLDVKNKYMEQRNAVIIQMLKNGTKVKQIAAIENLGIAERTVYDIKQSAGI